MGYTLIIGQRGNLSGDATMSDLSNVCPSVMTHEDAPAYGEPTDRTNMRWPSYSNWGNFNDYVGLVDVFYNDETGLMRVHPGCYAITIEHQAEIDRAYEQQREKHPDAIARMGETGVLEQDYQLARLTWLKYWIDYALKNCESPVFYNS